MPYARKVNGLFGKERISLNNLEGTMYRANSPHSINNLVVHQLKAYWTDISETDIRSNVLEALRLMDEDFKDINSPRF